MVVGLLGNKSPDSNRFTLVTPKSENDVRLQATLANQNPTGLPVGTVREIGEYKGHRYEIGFTFGPVAYVEMDNCLTDEEADEIPVHGGVTFKCYGEETGKRCEDDFIENEKFYIGWDYQHYGDKSVYSWGPSLEGKEWTRDEIVAEIYAVIELLERKK